jgi:hypothetical protein
MVMGLLLSLFQERNDDRKEAVDEGEDGQEDEEGEEGLHFRAPVGW